MEFEININYNKNRVQLKQTEYPIFNKEFLTKKEKKTVFDIGCSNYLNKQLANSIFF